MKETYPYKKTCLYCNEQYKGRLNSKFCTPSHKALYHADINRQNEEVENKKYDRYRMVVDLLIKNCEILDSVLEKNTVPNVSVTRNELLQLGYSFQYHTSIDGQEGYNVFMSFDKGLKILGVDTYEIVTKQ